MYLDIHKSMCMYVLMHEFTYICMSMCMHMYQISTPVSMYTYLVCH